MPHKVRRPVFDGVRLVHGVWFDVGLIGEIEARRRIFTHWEPGARLHRAIGGYVLEFALARLCRCVDLDGLPLCEQDGVLSSAPLTKAERVGIPSGAVSLVRGAQATALQLTAEDRIDPAVWLDLRHIPVREPLQPPRFKHHINIDAQESAKSLRAILGDTIPEPSEKRAAFLRDAGNALRDGKPSQGSGLSNGAPLALGIVALGVLGLLLTWIGGGQIGKTGAQTRQSARPSKLSPWAQRLADAAARLAMFTRISKLLGRRQAAYLRRMLDMFEDGNWEEALRHAIPLDSLQQNAGRQAFGTPRPRDSLTVTGPNRLAASIGLAAEVQQHLRQTYRRTFERLDRDGRIDEAVFVLAELLQAGAEAVTYLERKGRLKQAAELAETVEIPTEIAVRLWWMAGNFERAALLARRANIFADAVRLLEKSHAAEAVGLRKLWAEHLAAQGNLTEAAEAIWPLQEHRDLARNWLLQAEQSGGAIGVRALIHKLMLAPESLVDSEEAVSTMLFAKDEDGAQVRARIAIELLNLKTHSAATKRLAAEVLRPLLSERLAGKNHIEKRDLDKLLALADASIMRADLPTLRFPELPKSEALSARSAALSVRVEECGLQPIHDARCLPDGQYLLALGESGVLRIDRRGRTVAHYPVPAHRMVVAASGQRALALARRDHTFRISRLDLLTSHVTDWLSLPLEFWSEHYDGVTWNAILDNRLVAIDVTQNQLTVNWQVADFPGKIIGFAEDRTRQVLLIAGPDGLEQWRYLLPARRLNQRDSLGSPDSDLWNLLPYTVAEEPLKLYLLTDDAGTSLIVQKRSKSDEIRVALGALTKPPEVQAHGGWLTVSTCDGHASRCLVVDLRDGKTKADLFLLQSSHPRVHIDDQHILFVDRAGRVIDLDCQTGQMRTLVIN